MPALETVNILLVDDQPGKLLTYEAMLSQMEVNLIKATSGREALEHLLRTDITVVLMDVSMPELDGFELAELIRSHPRHQKTAIIFVSAVHLTDLDRLKGYETGAVDYVSVPVIPELLRAKLNVFIELYRKRQESERLTTELEQRVAERTAELEAAIARQTELAAELRAADQRKDEFLALLAHELRNPLAPVLNAVNIMRLKEIEDPEIRWCRDVIERQVHQSTRLVDDLLDVSRITQGKITLRIEPLDLSTIVRDAVETSRPLIDAQHHELRLLLAPGPCWVQGDATRLTQVLANLLNNAAKYQTAHGRIDLTVTAGETGVEVRVRDYGIGIEADKLSEIFQLFAQGERRLDRAFGGLGIGLFLVRNLVELHGGKIQVFSEGRGRGAEFVVRLPVAAPPAGMRKSPAGGTATVTTPFCRILVVDDNRDAADSLAKLLRLHGHAVEVVHDGLAAVARAASYRPEIVFLDIGLPGMDGYEVCRHIRQLDLNGVKIFAMTGYAQDRDRQRSDAAGFDAHTVKPVGSEELGRLLAVC